MFRFGSVSEQHYHVDQHGQLTLKQLRLSVLNEMHTNSNTGPRLIPRYVDFSALYYVVNIYASCQIIIYLSNYT